MPWKRALCALLALTASVASAHAQSKPGAPALDLGVTFEAQRSLNAGSQQHFWLTGGRAELGASAWHGLGAAFALSGTHAENIANSQVPLSLVVWTAGPRYRWHSGHRLSLYVEAMAGEANGFRSLFPAPGAAQPDANSLAVQGGGGLDLAFRKHLAWRVVDASYLRTQLPNSVNNTQSLLTLGSGLVLRFH